MAVLPTIPDVFRVSFEFPVNLGVKPSNVIHIFSLTGNEGDVGTAMVANAQANMFAGMSQAYDCLLLNILKLDGVSATVPFTVPTGTFKGTQAGSDQSPQVCALVSLHTSQRGPRGRGRIYIGPQTEANFANGSFDATKQGQMATGWSNFVAGMAGDDFPMVVASYVHADANEVTSLHVDSILATQRRRIDQLR